MLRTISSVTIRCASFLFENILLYFFLLALNITFSIIIMDLINAIPTASEPIESFKLLTGYYFEENSTFWKSILLFLLNGIIWIILAIVPIMVAISTSEEYARWLRILLLIFGVSFLFAGLYFIGHAINMFVMILILGGILWFFVRVLSR